MVVVTDRSKRTPMVRLMHHERTPRVVAAPDRPQRFAGHWSDWLHNDSVGASSAADDTASRTRK